MCNAIQHYQNAMNKKYEVISRTDKSSGNIQGQFKRMFQHMLQYANLPFCQEFNSLYNIKLQPEAVSSA